MAGRQIILSVRDYAGVEVVLHDTTLKHIQFRHPDFSPAHITECLESPVVVHTNPQDHEHPDRQSYYAMAETGPQYRRVVVDHSDSPGEVITGWRTNDVGKYGSIVYVNRGGGQ